MYTHAIISITTVIQTHLQMRKQADSAVLTRTVLLTSDFGSSTRGERHSSYYADHTIWPPTRVAHLAMFWISVGRDPKIPTTSFNSQSQLSTQRQRTQLSASMVQCQLSTVLFENLQILRTISSWHDVIHNSAPFPVWGLLWRCWLCTSVKLYPMTMP